MNNLFITGMIRSGTTLLEKILTNHQNMFIASQPFPFLYINLKENYNKKYGLESKPYAINTNFRSTFSLAQFTEFLQKKIISYDEIISYLKLMKEYSGCNSPQIYKFSNNYKEDFLVGVYKQICKTALINKKFDSLYVLGSKEVLGEDFINYFLANKLKVILIIRDPRDIITSSNFSIKNNFVGKRRPIIYLLRMWRKSIAHMIKFKNNSNFMVIKYEDLVMEPNNILNRISKFLNIPPFHNLLLNGLKDQNGKPWKGNSSFGEKKMVDLSSIGRHRNRLDEKTVKYIESTCFPEMVYSGYLNKKDYDEKYLYYQENIDNIHHIFINNSINPTEILNEEKRRLRLLMQEIVNDNLIIDYFLFNEVYSELKRVIV